MMVYTDWLSYIRRCKVYSNYGSPNKIKDRFFTCSPGSYDRSVVKTIPFEALSKSKKASTWKKKAIIIVIKSSMVWKIIPYDVQFFCKLSFRRSNQEVNDIWRLKVLRKCHHELGIKNLGVGEMLLSHWVWKTVQYTQFNIKISQTFYHKSIVEQTDMP